MEPSINTNITIITSNDLGLSTDETNITRIDTLNTTNTTFDATNDVVVNIYSRQIAIALVTLLCIFVTMSGIKLARSYNDNFLIPLAEFYEVTDDVFYAIDDDIND